MLLIKIFISISLLGMHFHTVEAIHDGTPAGPDEFIFAAALVFLPNSFECGCTIADEKTVVCGRHCFTTLDVDSWQIRVGDHKFLEGTRHSVEKLIPHPRYDPLTLQFDVIVVKLNVGIDFHGKDKPAGSVTLPLYKAKDGDFCEFAGWGFTSEYGGFPTTLLKMKTSFISAPTCKRLLHQWIEFQVCRGYTSGTHTANPCRHDSGGPLVCFIPKTGKWSLIGTLSFSSDCAVPNGIARYVDVQNAEVRNFIRDHMEKPPEKIVNGQYLKLSVILALLVFAFIL